MFLLKHFNSIFYNNRSKYLNNTRTKRNEQDIIIPFINTYYPLIKEIGIPKIISTNWNKYVLQNNNCFTDKYKKMKPLICWKMSENIIQIINKNKRLIINSKIEKDEDPERKEK
jgi:hypothetical protein